MSQPYCIQSDVTNQALLLLLQQAQWNLVANGSSDVEVRIQEADSEIDSRLAGVGYSLPFSNNPPLLKQLSIMYSRYACFRDLFAGGSPSGGSDATKAYEERFEKKMDAILAGSIALVDAFGNVVSNGKYSVSFTTNDAPLLNPNQLISSYIADYDKQDGLFVAGNVPIVSGGVVTANIASPGLYDDIIATNPSAQIFRFATDAKQLLFYTGDVSLGVNGWEAQ